jgi:acyl phosphate:glycerol-3-phosphate acyltransferase
VTESINLTIVFSTLLAYIIGGLPFGFWFVKLSSGSDIRTMGSGNIGATNVQRTAGTKAGLIVLTLDILKGFLAVWLAGLMNHRDLTAMALAACAVMVGHCYPLFLRFKGGKAVACFIGAFAMLTLFPLLAVVAVFILTVAFSRFVSLGSVVGALVFPFLVWFIQHPPAPLVYAAIFAGVLVLYRHRANIGRLLAGTESVFSFKGKKV